MAQNFAATVAQWTREVEGATEAVFKEAAQAVLADAQTPGYSVASTKHAIKKGLGARGRGSKRALVQGPVNVMHGAGNLPVDSGFLRGSLTVGINTEPGNISTTRAGEAYAMEIIPAKLGDTLLARWTANYAAHVEYGAKGRAGRGFARQAAQKWLQIVASVEARLAARLGR